MARRPGDVPFVIKEAGKAVDKDVKPVINLLGRILLGGALPKQPKPPSVPAPETKPNAARLPPSESIVVVQVRPGAPSPSQEVILDAEFIEEEDFPRICPTCGGAGRLGRVGHEVPCPSCNPRR
jgi:hypothetical protein